MCNLYKEPYRLSIASTCSDSFLLNDPKAPPTCYNTSAIYHLPLLTNGNPKWELLHGSLLITRAPFG